MKVILNTIRMKKKWSEKEKKCVEEKFILSRYSSKQVQYKMRLQNAKVHTPVIRSERIGNRYSEFHPKHVRNWKSISISKVIRPERIGNRHSEFHPKHVRNWKSISISKIWNIITPFRCKIFSNFGNFGTSRNFPFSEYWTNNFGNFQILDNK